MNDTIIDSHDKILYLASAISTLRVERVPYPHPKFRTPLLTASASPPRPPSPASNGTANRSGPDRL